MQYLLVLLAAYCVISACQSTNLTSIVTSGPTTVANTSGTTRKPSNMSFDDLTNDCNMAANQALVKKDANQTVIKCCTVIKIATCLESLCDQQPEKSDIAQCEHTKLVTFNNRSIDRECAKNGVNLDENYCEHLAKKSYTMIYIIVSIVVVLGIILLIFVCVDCMGQSSCLKSKKQHPTKNLGASGVSGVSGISDVSGVFGASGVSGAAGSSAVSSSSAASSSNAASYSGVSGVSGTSSSSVSGASSSSSNAASSSVSGASSSSAVLGFSKKPAITKQQQTDRIINRKTISCKKEQQPMAKRLKSKNTPTLSQIRQALM